MKKLIVLSAIFISGLLCGSTFCASIIQSQYSQPTYFGDRLDTTMLNITIFLEEIDVYYYVPNQKFIYMQYGH